MAFTFDPTTDVGRVRLRLFDTSEQSAIFSDEVIEALIADEGGWRGAVAEGARICLAQISRFARNYSTTRRDGTSESVDETASATYLERLIELYSTASPTIPRLKVRRLKGYPSDPFYRN
jgi:hypothetical protein